MRTRDEIDDLIAQVALGNRRAFSDLYSHTSAKLFGVCLRVLGQRDLAEDALQETFVKIWHNAGRYHAGTYSPMTWLITIARNTAIDRKRKLKAEARRDEREDAAELVPDAAHGPARLAEIASDMRALAACMGELPEGRAEAVRRAYLDGDSYAELADRFEVPLNTMRTWLRRALISLRECLGR
ncbi:sigma-70 family RNA polymerase sigma factor [Pseudaestuariivita atlantica]|uniref:RNA polymerase sigma factor n=1 Tax=Pseudaestuariivita atlantica TaxID=1317121 RepID=A0A0L1JTJ6_9RHOB|nr:sigma-70 family RNA polymerase sigma factor [Pseudaestuariivita atlantica]KNG95086.1 RNA polymerase sigma factor [Pseudaestuariivita atlantica]